MTARIAGHLLESATTKPGAGTRARISQGRLAVAAGTGREVTSRSLGELRDAGVVVTHRGTVLIVDRPRLSRVAHGDERVAPARARARASSTTLGLAPLIPPHLEQRARLMPTASSAGLHCYLYSGGSKAAVNKYLPSIDTGLNADHTGVHVVHKVARLLLARDNDAA